jgi:hypothetical protein
MHMVRDKIQYKYRNITMLSLYYSINNSSNSSTVILAALAVPVAARAANPTSLLACTAVSDAVTLAVALDHSLTSNG